MGTQDSHSAGSSRNTSAYHPAFPSASMSITGALSLPGVGEVDFQKAWIRGQIRKKTRLFKI